MVSEQDIVFLVGSRFPILCLPLPFRLLSLNLLCDLLVGKDSLWALSVKTLEVEVLDERSRSFHGS